MASVTLNTTFLLAGRGRVGGQWAVHGVECAAVPTQRPDGRCGVPSPPTHTPLQATASMECKGSGMFVQGLVEGCMPRTQATTHALAGTHSSGCASPWVWPPNSGCSAQGGGLRLGVVVVVVVM